MASAKLTVTAPVDLVSAGQIDSIAQLVSVLLVDASYGDITQAHFKQSVCTPIAIGPVAPASPYVGLHWWDSSETRAVLKAYSGTDWYPVSYWREDTAPSSPQIGDLWYDQTLRMFRVYKTEDEITYWHPIAEGYQLLANEGGVTDIEAGHVVSLIAPVNSKRPCSISGAVSKLTNVLGVALEDIPVTSPVSVGVVAMVGCPTVVEVKVTTADHHVATGDWLVTSGTAGVARSAGQGAANPYVSETKRTFGRPLGAFAQAVEANTSGSTATIKARLSECLGEGMTVIFAKKQVAAIDDTIPDGDDLTAANLVDGTSREIDLTNTPRSGTSVLESDKHEPILGAYMSLDVAVTGGASENAEFSVGDYTLFLSGSSGGAAIKDSMERVLAITTDGDATNVAMGEILDVVGTTDSAAAVTSYNLYCHGYVC